MNGLEYIFHPDNSIIEKIFFEYKILIKKHIDSMIIIINDFESTFKLSFFKKINFFESDETIDDITNKISQLIDNKQIKIEKNEINLILILQLTEININLSLNKIPENKKFKYIKSINLSYKTTIYAHIGNIWSMSVFPSGNIISVAEDKSIIIFDKNYNIIQNIQNAHSDAIYFVNIKDENNFVTCSRDKNIIIWEKINNNFIIKEKIINAHEDNISKVIYLKNDNIISCSIDNTVKIWELNNNNKHQCLTVLTHSNNVTSILYLEDKKILISSGEDQTIFWNTQNYSVIKNFDDVECCSNDSLIRLNDDQIIVAYDDIIKVLSVSEQKVIKEIENYLIVWCICILKDLGIFLTVGYGSKIIRIYNIETFQCIQAIKGTHNDDIIGVIYLNNKLIGTYSFENIIKVWSISETYFN